MAFWTTTPDRDPKRNFRFQVFMTGIQDSEPAVWWAKKVAKPNWPLFIPGLPNFILLPSSKFF